MTTDTIPIANKKTAQLVTPPKYFDNYLEKLLPEEFAELKKERKKKAEIIQKLKNAQTDLSPQEQREIREKKLKERTKSLIREGDFKNELQKQNEQED